VATLVDKDQNSGSYIVVWNAQSVSSGIYLYRITAGDYTDTKRMVLKIESTLLDNFHHFIEGLIEK
jgi:hypothetical protein